MAHRRVQAEEVAERTDGGDVVHRQRLVVDAHAADDMLDHARDLVVDDQLRVIEGDARLDHSQAVDQVGPCQRCHEGREGLLVTGLRVTELGVPLRTGDVARQPVAAGELRRAALISAHSGVPTEAATRRRSMAVVDEPYS